MERNYEEEAKVQGWKPQEEFEGDSDKWVDAKTFVERGENSLGIWKDRFEKVERRLQYQEQINTDLKNQYKRFEQSKQKEVERLIKQLEEERKRAVTRGDGDAFDKADKELNQLKAQAAQQATDTANTPPPWAMEWMQENEWYSKDQAMTVVAENYAERLKAANPYLSEKDFLVQVTEYVKTQFPHKFEKKKVAAPDVEPTRKGSDDTSSNGKLYANLPADAKRECNRLLKEGIIKDKEDYAKIYFEDEE